MGNTVYCILHFFSYIIIVHWVFFNIKCLRFLNNKNVCNVGSFEFTHYRLMFMVSYATLSDSYRQRNDHPTVSFPTIEMQIDMNNFKQLIALPYA